MSLRPRLSFRRMRRYPLLWWTLVVFMAGIVGFVVTSSVASARSSAARFDGLTTVAVFTRDLSAGSLLTAADVRTETRPRAFLTSSPLVLDPTGRTLNAAVAAGDIANELNTGVAGLSPTAALVKRNERAIALSLRGLHPTLQVDDRVDVLATFERDDAEIEPTIVIAEGARVVQIEDDTVMVSVPAEQAPKVAYATAKGTVVLALSGGRVHSER